MDWDARYLNHDTPWDKQAPHPAWKAFFTDKHDLGAAFVPGCGFGHDAGFLAATQSFSKVVATDIAEQAIGGAKVKYPAVEFYRSDFLSSPPVACYDWVCEHTLYCAIEPSLRDSYLRAVATALRSNGFFLAIFYLETGNPEGVGPPYRSDSSDLDRRFEKFFELVDKWTPEETFAGREGKEQVRLYQRNKEVV